MDFPAAVKMVREKNRHEPRGFGPCLKCELCHHQPMGKWENSSKQTDANRVLRLL